MTNREAIADGANPCDQVAELVMRLDKLGYRGDYSFEVFNDDYQQMPMEPVCARAFRAAEWLRRGATAEFSRGFMVFEKIMQPPFSRSRQRPCELSPAFMVFEY
jgi:hypothetical protein